MKNQFKTRRRKVALIGFTGGVVLAGCSFFLLTGSPQSGDGEVGRDPGEPTSIVLDRFDPTIADPSYDPETVVRMQLESLAKSAEDPEHLIVCYSLASPGNREITGPISRFARLFSDPVYQPLVGLTSMMIGYAAIAEPYSTVTATIVSADGETYSYRFILSRQRAEMIRGTANLGDGATIAELDMRDPDDDGTSCWMTDSVSPVLFAEEAPKIQLPWH